MWSGKAFEEATAMVQGKDGRGVNEADGSGIEEKWLLDCENV